MAKIVPRSLKVLHPGVDFSDISIDDKIVLYFKGLDRNLYFHFQQFISKVASHGR